MNITYSLTLRQLLRCENSPTTHSYAIPIIVPPEGLISCNYYRRCVCKIPANDDPKILLFLSKRESIHKKSILPSLCFVLGLYNYETFQYRCRTADCTL